MAWKFKICFSSFLIIGLTLMLFGEGEGVAQNYSGKKLEIYLLIGQSNMAGRAEMKKELLEPMKEVYLFNDKSEFEVAKNPLNRYSTVRKGLNMQKLGPGYSFAQAMVVNDKIEIGLVVNAKGGTSIKEWKKDKLFYKEIIRRANEASKFGVIKGILWHQGESDSGSATYVADLAQLINDLRADLKLPQLPFVAGQITKKGDFNKNILTLPSLVRFTGVATAEDLTTTDGTHFDTKSQLLLGKRYADAMSKIK